MALYDEEAEQIVLGSLLQNPELFLELSQILKPEDFFFEQNRIIFKAISEENDRGNKPDLTLVIANLKRNENLNQAGNRAYLAQIAGMASAFSALASASDIKEYSVRRHLVSSVKEIEKRTLDVSEPLADVLGDAENRLFLASDRFSSFNVQHVRDVKEEFNEFLRKVKESEGGITGQATGFHRFDQLTSGLKGGQMLVLAARPGVGKTTLALNMLGNIALKQKQPVLLFSLEMTKLELLIRLVCAEAFLDAQKIQKGYISKRDMEQIVEACRVIYASDIYIDDSPGLTSWEFKQRSRRLAAMLATQKKQLGIIVVDYLQLMSDRSGSESRQLEVANISRSLKLIAKDLNVPVMALSQMNRSIEQRGKDPRPQLSDLRESGAIEQDADIVMFIHREELHNRDLPESERGQADLIIAKHRAGPTGTVKLGFIREKNMFMELDDTAEKAPE